MGYKLLCHFIFVNENNTVRLTVFTHLSVRFSQLFKFKGLIDL